MEAMFARHPRGLSVLFFTEMWERFGFYLMLGIFTLYMIDTRANGLGLSATEAADIYGTYIALVYLTPFIGGLLADRVIGYRKAVISGGLLMGAGYSGLAVPGLTAFFWLSLGLIILGNGLFKSSISTLVGNLYDDDRYRLRKDSGFSIFYMGINIGAFVSNFIAALLRNQIGWSAAFLAAGVGMFLGVIWFIAGSRHVAAADVRRPAAETEQSVGRILLTVLGPATLFALFGWFVIPLLLGGETLFGSRSNDAFLLASLPVVWFYFSLWRREKGENRARIGALLPIFAVVIVFWAVFHQNGAALTLWAERYTDRELPAALAPLAEAMGTAQTVAVPESPGGQADPYFENLPTSQWPPADGRLKLISTELFQSINPFFVVLFTPLVVGLFTALRRRNREPSTPGKIALGLFITAASTLIMVAATFATENGAVKAAAWWLVATYAVITIGELFLSPMGLSLVSKTSPPRLAALMMGGWFLSTAIGNKLSGILSGLLVRVEHKSSVFLLNFAGATLAGLVILVLLPRLKRVMAGQ